MHANLKLKLAAIAATAVCSVGALAAVAPAAADAYSNPPGTSWTGPFTHQVRTGTNSCLDDTNYSTAPLNRMQIWQCLPNDPDQLWRWVEGWTPQYGSVNLLQNMQSGLCLSDYNRGTYGGVPAVQWYCNYGDPAENFWTMYGGIWTPRLSTAMCLDDPYGNASNGVYLGFWPCNGGPQQNWSQALY